MYNRYVRNDNGQYQRIPVPDNAPPPPGAQPAAAASPQDSGGYDPFFRSGGPQYRSGPYSPPPNGREKRKGFLSGILSRLNLDNIDTGDLLLLLILILLFQDGEDEEMLIALGLLLIL